MDHVILHRLRADDQVAQEPGVGGRPRPDRILDGADRGNRMDRRADAADPLGERPGVARIASLQNDLDPAKHRRRRPGVLHGSAIDLGFDPEVALDASDGIDDDTSHTYAPFVGVFGVSGSALSPTRFMIWIRPWPANAAATPATA